MSVEKNQQVEDPKWTIRKKCVECFRGPNLLRTLIIAVCVGVVIQQISSCVSKLINIPITTHAHFDFNKTIQYPSITFCREPPYKFDKMLDYNLYVHPRWTSEWRNFNFSNITLDELWEDITYNDKDIFVQYGFSGFANNVELTSTMGFEHGRCYTMTPKIAGTNVNTASGYSVTLQHNSEDIANHIGIDPPGYHIFIHYSKEPFTEVTVYNGGQVDTLFVHVAETVEVKLKVDQYVKISKDGDPCSDEDVYSTNGCTIQYVWNRVGEEVGCSGPWMASDLPRCDNHTAMTKLISTYVTAAKGHNSPHCPRICSSLLYNGYVTDRQKYFTWNSALNEWTKANQVTVLQTTLYVYFNSMMVSVYEEQYNYDWNLFVSDLGGSVGFLLGLSVISLLHVIGKAWKVFIDPCIIKKKKTKSIMSTETADISTIRQDYIARCNELNGGEHEEKETPMTYREALSSLDKDKWKKSIEEELQAHSKNETWELVKKPDGVKTIGSKWVFKVKDTPSGPLYIEC